MLPTKTNPNIILRCIAIFNGKKINRTANNIIYFFKKINNIYI